MTGNESAYRSIQGLSRVVVAGLLGGVAEMAWVILYCGPAGGAEVSRQVTETVLGTASLPHAIAWGVAIHLALSVGLALGYARFVWKPLTRHFGPATQFVASCAALAVVWLLNFHLVLPVLNPAFLELMPYSVTLASKLMFGLAMAAGLMLQGAGARARA